MSHSDFYRGVEATAAVRHACTSAQHAAAVHAAIEPLLQATSMAADRACRSGCAHCCHFPVGVTFGEALLLAAAVENLPEVRAELVAACEQDADVPWRDLIGRPCPFLRDGLCAVHAQRPLPCRALFSSDADACARSLRGTGTPPLDGEAFFRGLGAADALAGAGDVPGTRELRSAVHAVITSGSAGPTTAFLAARAVGS